MELLEYVQGGSAAKGDGGILKIDGKKLDEVEIRREMERLKKRFCEIKNGEISLQADGYENYSMGYGGDNWVWEYDEADEIRRVYETARRHMNFDAETYFKGTGHDTEPITAVWQH